MSRNARHILCRLHVSESETYTHFVILILNRVPFMLSPFCLRPFPAPNPHRFMYQYTCTFHAESLLLPSLCPLALLPSYIRIDLRTNLHFTFHAEFLLPRPSVAPPTRRGSHSQDVDRVDELQDVFHGEGDPRVEHMKR